jgi:hypothetical protein
MSHPYVYTKYSNLYKAFLERVAIVLHTPSPRRARPNRRRAIAWSGRAKNFVIGRYGLADEAGKDLYDLVLPGRRGPPPGFRRLGRFPARAKELRTGGPALSEIEDRPPRRRSGILRGWSRSGALGERQPSSGDLSRSLHARQIALFQPAFVCGIRSSNGLRIEARRGTVQGLGAKSRPRKLPDDVTSYGEIPAARQAEIIRGLAGSTDEADDQTDLEQLRKLAEKLARRGRAA